MTAGERPTVIKINAITVPEDSGDELARRFAARAGAVDNQEGFEGFELLRPTDERRQWLVVTRWRDEESFQSWVSSPAFAHGHAGADRPSPHGGPGLRLVRAVVLRGGGRFERSRSLVAPSEPATPEARLAHCPRSERQGLTGTPGRPRTCAGEQGGMR